MPKKLNLTPAAMSALSRGDLGDFLTAATPGGIEAQEAAGQAELCMGSRLPIEFLHDRNKGDGQRALEAAGVLFGAKIDELFCEVTLPVGWKLVPTDHSMWSTLVDADGRERAQVFYKAAFYDRKAHIQVTEEKR